jgi:hypothetical protein
MARSTATGGRSSIPSATAAAGPRGFPNWCARRGSRLPAAVPDDQAAALVARFTDAEGLGRLSASDLLTLLVAG